MIFYFTGTGNSGYVATKLAKENNERLISISELITKNLELEFNLEPNEMIGIIYPIYAWAAPKMVREFIKKVKFNQYDSNNNYVFIIATCGENIGNAIIENKKQLALKGIKLNSGFSIAMPNNYMLMSDVESKELQKEKLKKAEESLNEINAIIKNRQDNVFNMEKGPMPIVLTKIINPLFEKTTIKPSKFYVTEDCISCGICKKVCTTNNIYIDNKKPIWGKECSQCLACINYCPKGAIQYGKGTLKKGRYTNPYYKI